MSARPAGSLIVSAPGSRLEAERAKDIWDMSQFGHTGRLHFTAINQPWLRAAAKEWAIEDLLHHRGATVTSTMQAHVAALAELSASLHSHRSDHGLIVGELGRSDIDAFLQRLAFRQHQNKISALSRSMICRKAHHTLRQMRLFGLARSGRPLSGLPADFELRPSLSTCSETPSSGEV